MEITLTLGEAEVKEIVKEWALKQGYASVTEVKVNTGTEENERCAGSSWTVLRNVEVKVTKSV